VSALGEALRAHNVFNTHGLLSQFGDKGRDVAVSYSPASRGLRCGTNGTSVWSPSFQTDQTSAWYNYKKKHFVGKRTASFEKAKAWATENYGISEWAVCPLTGDHIPRYVLDRAKAWLKDQR
jgi:hypothetical protein